MNDYSVKQLADSAKVSIRTLHYYDEIGLLKPRFKAQNNYRFYGDIEALRLQQILIYREMGMELRQIKEILDAPDFDLVKALEEHQARIKENIERQEMLFAAITSSIEKIKRKEKMEISKLYEWNSEIKNAGYIEWLKEKYSSKYDAAIEHANKAFTKLDDSQRQKIMDQIKEIEADIVNAYNAKIIPGDEALDPILDAHRNWIAYMWAQPCPKPAYSILADTYLSHADFVARYEALAKGFSEYLPAAMKAYAEKA